MTDQTPDPWQIRLLTARLEDVIRDTFPENNGRTHFEECWRAHAPCVLRRALDVLNALAAERAQRQQVVESLRRAGWTGIDYIPQGVEWLVQERAQHQQEIAQRDETIRQLQDAFARCQEVQQATAETWRIEHDQMAEQIATLTQERDKAQQLNAAAYIRARRQANVCEPNMDQYAGAMAVIRAAFPNGHIDFSDWVHIGLVEQPSDLLQAVKRRAEAAEARCATLTAALEQLVSETARCDRPGLYGVSVTDRAYVNALNALSGVPTP